jgi:uncharacterized protein YbjT (DUF2867 family)
VAVVRDLAAWRALELAGEARVVGFDDHFSLSLALKDATHIVSCAPAAHTKALLAAAPEDALNVLLGCASRFTRWPGMNELGVMEGERVFLGAGRAGVMLHPTMIYGGDGADPVRRLAALAGRLPFLPLPVSRHPGTGTLVQPIHLDDVVRCVLAALERNWRDAETLVIAGPQPIPFADFIRLVTKASGARAPAVFGTPAALLTLLAPLSGLIPGIPTVDSDAVRRLAEDKSFDIMPMFNRLGVVPASLAQGLSRMFAIVP